MQKHARLFVNTLSALLVLSAPTQAQSGDPSQVHTGQGLSPPGVPSIDGLYPDPLSGIRGGIPKPAFADSPPPQEMPMQRPVSRKVAPTPEIERILALPDEEIDVGRAVLEMTAAIFPFIGVAKYDTEITRLADEAKNIAGPNADPLALLAAVREVIYKVEGYRYDHSKDATKNDANWLLPNVIEKKIGHCYGLTILAMSVAQRAGLRAYPVLAPSHVFLRIMGPGFKVTSFEPTSNTISSDEYYINWLKINEQGIKSGAYMRTESYKEFLAHVMRQTAVLQRRYSDLDDKTRLAAIAWLEKAVSLNPYAAEVAETLRWAYESERTEAAIARDMKLADSYAVKAAALFKKTEELGYQEVDEATRQSAAVAASHQP